MKKNTLTPLLVCVLTALVPTFGIAQSSPDSKSETGKAKKSEPKATKPLTLADGAPNSYTVVRGDTLWGISGRFLKDPWRWPEVWNMNKEQIKDPHWIYPGDIVSLSFDADGRPRLSIGANGGGGEGSTVRLSPKVRTDAITTAIPSIPSSAISPFLSLPLVVEADGLANAPRIVAAEDGRVIIGAGNTAYAVGLNPQRGVKWQIYRPGKALVDPTSKEVLGYEATYLGDAKVTRFGETSSLEVLKSTQEINRGDRLTPTLESTLPSYSPHAPDKQIKGAIVSVVGGVDDAAQYFVVALNLGKKDGMEIGHVLATLQLGETVSTADNEADRGSWFGRSKWFSGNTESADAKPSSTDSTTAELPATVKLPDERNGLAFVFRVFDRISYALVMSSRRPLKVGDVVQTP